MCRRKGSTYRKWNTKKIIRIQVPHWTIRQDTIDMVKARAKEVGISESRIVDIALREFINRSVIMRINPDKFFSKT